MWRPQQPRILMAGTGTTQPTDNSDQDLQCLLPVAPLFQINFFVTSSTLCWPGKGNVFAAGPEAPPPPLVPSPPGACLLVACLSSGARALAACPLGNSWLRLKCVIVDETDQWLHRQRQREVALGLEGGSIV